MIEALGEAWSAGWRVHLRCAQGKVDGITRVPECFYQRELEVETLLCTRGRDFPLSRLAERMRCPRCGSRRVAIVYAPPAGRTMVGQG